METTPVRIPLDLFKRLEELKLPGQSAAGVLAEILPDALDRAEKGRAAMAREVR